MADYVTIQTQVQNLVSSNSMISIADIQGIIGAEHTTILEDYSWSRRKNETLINLSVPVSTGTVTGTGTTITGTSTSFTASMVGSFIRIASNTFYHQITAVGSTTSLTIEAALPAAIATASAYVIFKHIYELPPDFGRITSVVSDVRLTEWARPEIDRQDPYRSVTGARPDIYTILGPNYPTSATHVFHIEFWPVPSTVQAMRIEYLKTNSLAASTDVPLYRSDVLVWKAAESAAYFLFGKTGDQAWMALADRYHVRYTEALQGAREDDLAKFSTASYVKDRAVSSGRGDDFFLSHDPLGLR